MQLLVTYLCIQTNKSCLLLKFDRFLQPMFYQYLNITVKMSAVLEYIPVDGKVNIIFFPLQKCKRANWKMA